jgi:glutathione S-transferase
MTLTLYDLCTGDADIRPSPYCWMVKFALLHKGFDFETVPLRFTEKHNYPDPEYGKLPMLDDDGELICDSAVIVAHLEKKYPARPLVATAGEAAAAEFFRAWLATGLYPGLGPLTFIKVLDHLDDEGRTYFRETREKRLGRRLEDLAADPGAPAKVEQALATLAGPLEQHRFLGGEGANLCDYIAFSPLMWRRAVTAETPYRTPPAVEAWMERMLDLFDGYARKARRAEAA